MLDLSEQKTTVFDESTPMMGLCVKGLTIARLLEFLAELHHPDQTFALLASPPGRLDGNRSSLSI